jgi:ketosteroid isomerase-like protein
MHLLPEPLARLVDAIARRDLDAIEACFAVDYRNDTPAHPERSFTGRDQVRRNCEQILAAVPDLRASVDRVAVDGDTVWTEWHQVGTRADGAPLEMRGVALFGVAHDEITGARFYLEPVDRGRDGVDAAVRRHVGIQP